MKGKIVILAFMLCAISAYSQPTSNGPARSGPSARQILFDFQNAQAQALGMITGNSDVSVHFSNGSRNRMALGATLLHNNWENSGTVYTGDKEFFFDSMDFDLSTGALLIKMEGDVFSFSTGKIKKVVMNDVTYKVLYNANSGNYEFFETIIDEDGLQVLKGFKLVFKKGSDHVMFSTGQKNTLRRQEVYYAKTNSGLKRIKVSKKKLLKLIDKNDHVAIRNIAGLQQNRRVISN